MEVRDLAADLLAAVLQEREDLPQTADQIETMGTVRAEEWEVLTAVAASLRNQRTQGGRPEAEIHLLRHLAARTVTSEANVAALPRG